MIYGTPPENTLFKSIVVKINVTDNYFENE